MIVETLFTNARILGDLTSSPSTKCIPTFLYFLCFSNVGITPLPSLLLWCMFSSDDYSVMF